MAGAGAKLFNSGDVLTAAQVNTFLMDQAIMKFASTTARDAAFGGTGEPVLAEGMFAYTSDTDTLWYYTGSAWQAVSGSNIGTISTSNRNVVINGGFDVWQRGTTSTVTSKTYVADRWARDIPTGGTQSQETDVPSVQYRYSWKHVASATNAYMQSGQQIEYQNCKQFQNQVTTISFWAKAVNSNAGSTALTVRTRTIAGVDGACLFTGTNVDTSVTLTTSWARYTVARTMPATFGSASIELGLGSHVSGDGIFVTGLQWELGSVATPFEFEDFSTTLAKCQRYYHNNPYLLLGAQNGGFGNSYTTNVFFPVEMRATPTITTFSGVSYAGTAGQATWYVSAVGTAANVSFEASSALGYSIYQNGNATYHFAIFSYKASIEL
jgi:hypothetical protein